MTGRVRKQPKLSDRPQPAVTGAEAGLSNAQVLRERLVTLVDLVLAECSAANTVDHMDVEAVVDLLKGHLQASAAAKAMSAGEQNRARCQPWLARARCPLILQAGLGLAHGH